MSLKFKSGSNFIPNKKEPKFPIQVNTRIRRNSKIIPLVFGLSWRSHIYTLELYGGYPVHGWVYIRINKKIFRQMTAMLEDTAVSTYTGELYEELCFFNR